MRVQEAIDELDAAGANLRCKRLVKILESLEFVVESRRVEHHKTFKHPKIPHFRGGNFNCGHRRNPEVLRTYVGIVKRILIEYQVELEEIN